MSTNTGQTERPLYHGREAEYEVFDVLPPEVRRVFHNAAGNWSAKDCVDHWRNPLNLLDLPIGRTVYQQIIEDVRWADEQERKKDQALYRMMARGASKVVNRR